MTTEGRLIIYNTFFFVGKVPSLNEIIYARGVSNKMQKAWIPVGKKQSTYQFNMYNVIKRNWTDKVYYGVKASGFTPVKSAYFHYLLVENTKKRDPSNIVATAAKCVEDGLMKAGVIENDGWKTVLGIRPYWVHDKTASEGILLVMANEPLSQNAIESYYNEFKGSNKL